MKDVKTICIYYHENEDLKVEQKKIEHSNGNVWCTYLTGPPEVLLRAAIAINREAVKEASKYLEEKLK